MKFTRWTRLAGATCVAAVFALPSFSFADPASAPAASSALQQQIQTLLTNERAQQSQTRRLIRSSANAADIESAVAAMRSTQAQRQSLEQQQADLLKQQAQQQLAASGGAGAGSSSTGAFVATAGSSLSTGMASLGQNGVVSGGPANPVASTQQALSAARLSLAQQVQNLKQAQPGNNQALADAVNQWRAQNAGVMAQAEQAIAAQSAATRPKELARLQAEAASSAIAGSYTGLSASMLSGAGGAALSQVSTSSAAADAPAQSSMVPANLPPKMQALQDERNSAVRELQIILLQSASLSAEQKKAAITQWQANHAPVLKQLNQQAEDETKVLEAAADAKAAAGS